MPDPVQEALLKQDVQLWNHWRKLHPDERPDLSGADFSRADLSAANLARANLRGAIFSYAQLGVASLEAADLTSTNFMGANLYRAKLVEAQAERANFTGAGLMAADLRRANLKRATFYWAQLTEANLSGADLTESKLGGASIIRSTLDGAVLTGSVVFGVSAWGLDLSRVKDQTDLRITPDEEVAVTVDNLEVAQFVYVMLHNEKIRGIIDAVVQKGVLILGRFYDERKAVLNALRERLRDYDMVPIVFDFNQPTRRDLTETVQLLANLSRFIIADVTDAKSIPQELSHIIPFLPSVPIRPIILDGEYEYSMFEHWKSFDSVLEVYRYADRDELLANVEAAIIGPIEEWEQGFDQRRALHAKAAALEEQNRALQAELRELRGQLGRADA
jgi:uncharacterized protein YjbI with pentapeptide repeats